MFSLAALKSSVRTEWCWSYSVGARSCFRRKLHPSIQAWPLLSISNLGETVIAKSGNYSTGWYWLNLGLPVAKKIREIGVSGYSEENAWKEWPEMWHADVYWPPPTSILVSIGRILAIYW